MSIVISSLVNVVILLFVVSLEREDLGVIDLIMIGIEVRVF